MNKIQRGFLIGWLPCLCFILLTVFYTLSAHIPGKRYAFPSIEYDFAFLLLFALLFTVFIVISLGDKKAKKT